MLDLPEEPPSVQSFLEGARDRVPHIVLRGTYLPGTVRCATTVFRPRPYLGPDVYRFLQGNPILMCYADVRVNAYLLGSGPPTLTLKVAHDFYPETWGEAQIEEFKTAWEKSLTDASDGFGGFDNIEAFPGRETILFVGPTVGTAVEVWEVFGDWHLERRDDGAVIAVHPFRDYYSLEDHRAALEMELPRLRQDVIAAQKSRVAVNNGRVLPEPGHPMLITDVYHLPRFFNEVGAYEDGLVPERPPTVPPWRFATNVDTDPDTRPLEQPPPK